MADQLFDRDRLIWTRSTDQAESEQSAITVDATGPAYVINGDWMTVFNLSGTQFDLRLDTVTQDDLNTTLHDAGMHRGGLAGGCAKCWAV